MKDRRLRDSPNAVLTDGPPAILGNVLVKGIPERIIAHFSPIEPKNANFCDISIKSTKIPTKMGDLRLFFGLPHITSAKFYS